MYKVLTHTDADGITAAHLFSVAHSGEISGVTFPESFGGFETSDDSFVMTDMRPFKAGFLGAVYDHHLGYDEPGYKESDRTFKLVWKDIPASGIVYEEFKDKIPKEERWKVIVGYVGDGAVNKVPTEIWADNPELLDDILYLYEYRGAINATRLKIYQALSSPINAACKVGQPKTALEVLANAQAPLDIINNEMLKGFRTKIKFEISSILKDGRAQILSNQIIYFPFNSELPGIQSEIATKLVGKFNATVFVHNIEKEDSSIRGVLADYIVDGLRKNGYVAGGHHGFAGCDNPNKGDILEVLGDLAHNLGESKVKKVDLVQIPDSQ